ncbi:uncharacterized protein Dana_GF22018 [Drosophila ananassae]|uniref:Uncharacterized protein n=1 Tax=Drosophila ananassae TaxID=7217 RepID=B3MYJ8_DROAN|nr:clumping factor B [Drosophila ananassae]EDV32692.1 uncharacterized protein Dana_GF22018 [Drosophila ananassae]
MQDSWITSQSTITLKKFRDIGIEDGWKYVPTVEELGPPYFKTVEIPEKNILLSIVTDTTLYAKHNNLEYKKQPLIKRKFKFLGKGRKVEKVEEKGRWKDDKDKVRWRLVGEKKVPEVRRKITWQVVHKRQPEKKQDEEQETDLETELDTDLDTDLETGLEKEQEEDHKKDDHELQDMLLETSEEETESDPDPLDRALSDSDNPSMSVSSDECDPLDPISSFDVNQLLDYLDRPDPEKKSNKDEDVEEESNNKEFIEDHELYGMILESSEEESDPRDQIRSVSEDSDAPSMTVSDDDKYDPLEPEIILEEVPPPKPEPEPKEPPETEEKISVLQEKIAQLRNRINVNMNQYFK